MSNRIDTLEATLAALKRLEKKGVRSVYLDGIEVDGKDQAREREASHEPAHSQGLAPSIPMGLASLGAIGGPVRRHPLGRGSVLANMPEQRN